MGSWITYGLGTENQDLPGFITICPNLATAACNNWSSAFLPAVYQGTPIGNAGDPGRQARGPVHQEPAALAAAPAAGARPGRGDESRPSASRPGRRGAGRPDRVVRAGLPDADARCPRSRTSRGESAGDAAALRPGRCRHARTSAASACWPAASPSAASASCRSRTATRCKWDQHSGLKKGHAKNAREVDQPIAGLLKDLKARGLLEDTLVLWGGEFGRTPTAQGGDGRDHNPQGFTMWLAGGGVKGGIAYGATDEYGYYAVEDKVHIHDLHATILHLLGLDHES